MQSITQVPLPVNEPVHSYAPGTGPRARLVDELTRQAAAPLELTQTIGGVQAMALGEPFNVVQPHNHQKVLGMECCL